MKSLKQKLSSCLKSRESKGCKGEVDIIVFTSGGKDSSYALYKIIQNVSNPRRVLAVTMENGFLSEGARKNLRLLKEKLGVSHEYWHINQEVLLSFYRTLTKHGNPRSVCVGCNILSTRMEYEILAKYQPAFFVTGNSSAEYEKFNNWLKKKCIKETGFGDSEFEYRHGMWIYTERILKDVLDINSRECQQLSTPEPRLDDKISECERIRLFDYYKYDVQKIMKTLRELGWEQPYDVIGTETDCIFTQAIAHILIETNGEEAYTKKLNEMVTNGLPEEDKIRALERLIHYNPDLAKNLLQKVGYSFSLNSAINDLWPIR